MNNNTSNAKKIFFYCFLVIITMVWLYPLIWLLFSTMKPNDEIFMSTSLLPKKFIFDSFSSAWKNTGQIGFSVFMFNSFKLVIPVVIFTVISSVLVAYGFARFQFPLKKLLFFVMISTMMLPSTVIIIPRYLLFRDFGWINTYLPFIIPAMFACNAFFIYMFLQFFRGIPKELDESAKIDGCNSFLTLCVILVPLSKPAIISATVFQFIWTWNDFFNQLIYINSVSKFTTSLGLRITMDMESPFEWNQVLAMSFVSVLPATIIYFASQKYFVEGITVSGLKG